MCSSDLAREEAERVVRVAVGAPVLGQELRNVAGALPSRVSQLLERQPVEAVALAAALSASRDALATAERFLAEWRHVRPLLSGTDLRDAGLSGPEVGRGLQAARAVALDAPGTGRGKQLAAALEAAGLRPDAAG